MEAMANFPLVEGIQAFGCAALVSLVHSKSERVGALADLNGQSLAESALVSHPQSARVVELAELPKKRMETVIVCRLPDGRFGEFVAVCSAGALTPASWSCLEDPCTPPTKIANAPELTCRQGNSIVSGTGCTT
ncbi:unnamed protein product, partial [Symbiodinium microadriaticum]